MKDREKEFKKRNAINHISFERKGEFDWKIDRNENITKLSANDCYRSYH